MRKEMIDLLKAYTSKACGFRMKLLLLVDQYPFYTGHFSRVTRDLRLCEQICAKALLGWMIADEPDWNTKPYKRWKYRIESCRKAVKKIAPSRAMVIFTPHLINVDYFTPYADLILYHHTPVPTRFPMLPDVRLVNQHMGYGNIIKAGATVRRLAKRKQEFWTLNQLNNLSQGIMDIYPMVPKKDLRAPNADEICCSVFSSIATGARGIWFWSLKGLMENKDNKGYLERIERWEAVVRVVKELKLLDKLLRAKTPRTFQDVNHVAAMAKSDGLYTYLTMSNYDFETTDATLRFGGVRKGEAKVFVGDDDAEPTTIKNGHVKVRLRPFERRVYRTPGGPKSKGEGPATVIGMWAVKHLDDIDYLAELGFNAFTPMGVTLGR